MRSLMLEQAAIDAPAADALLGWLDGNRVKAIDLLELMTQQPWLQGTAIANTSATDITAPARSSSSK
jgi:hypothetical protein